MSKITVAFIKAAMVYFVLAMLLGIHMSRTGAVYPAMPVHVHFNLLGWISMMIYGVAYHILPRFSGQPLWSERLSVWHFWLANIGLIGMVFGWALIGGPGGGAILFIFSLVEGLSIIFFALNMFNTVKAAPPAPPRPPVRPRPPKPGPKAPEPKAEAQTKAPAKTSATGEKQARKKPAKPKKKAKPATKKVTKKEAEKETAKEPLSIAPTETTIKLADTKEAEDNKNKATGAAPQKETESAPSASPETVTAQTDTEEKKETSED